MERRIVHLQGLVASALALLLCCGAALALTAREAGAAELLPDLVADPPAAVSLSVDSAVGHPALLLRFDGYVHNAGRGALDFRGTRATWRNNTPMQSFQRIFRTEDSNWTDEASPAELIFSNADGHNHWHLQDTAKYSLWNAARTAEAAPAQKVGFCLMDSEHVDPWGPSRPVYADDVAPYRNFCQQNQPEALELFEGVSAGWRDLYDAGLAFQWVDASTVLPGSYWLREDVDPLDRIRESNEVNAPAWAAQQTTIPGYNAQPAAAATPLDTAVEIDWPVQRWGSPAGAATRTVVDQPAHGTLSAFDGGDVTYTPDPGWEGTDSFAFSARDAASAYPTSPAVATVTVTVGDAAPAPAVFISGAPDTMIAGTSVQLTAAVEHDAPGVTWSADAGSIDAAGLFVAPPTPPAGGTVTIGARSAAGAVATRTIAILPVPDSEPRPEPEPEPEPDPDPVPVLDPPVRAPTGTTTPTPPTPPTPTTPTKPPAPRLSGFGLLRIGQQLTTTTRPNVGGRVRISIYAGTRRLRECVARVPANRTVACRVTLPRSVGARTKISIVAGLRSGSQLTRRVRRAAPIAPMRMRRRAIKAGAMDPAYARRFWCPLPPR